VILFFLKCYDIVYKRRGLRWAKLMGGGGINTKKELVCSCKQTVINTLKDKLNPICHLLTLLAHHIFHVSRIRVKSRVLC